MCDLYGNEGIQKHAFGAEMGGHSGFLSAKGLVELGFILMFWSSCLACIMEFRAGLTFGDTKFECVIR